jgi:hypothetical protein
MWAEDDELHIRKGYMTFKSFYRAWRDNVDDTQSAVLHFRIRTHGLVDKANTHPHRINDRVAIAHNGILSSYGTGKHVSDTGLFVKLVLSQLPKNWWDNTGIQRLLEDAIGVSNKMVLMTNTGRVQIYNEPAGEWEDGAWYSNTGYKYSYYSKKKGKLFTSYNQHKHYAHNSRISVNDCEKGNTDPYEEYNVEDLTNDSMEEWSAQYAANVYPGLYVCLVCGDNIGNASLSTGICMKCNEPLFKDVYDTTSVCEHCYSVSVESFDECPVCRDKFNPYGVDKKDIVSLSLIKGEYLPKPKQIVLSMEKCIVCNARETMYHDGFKQEAKSDYEYKNYCLNCYYDKSDKREGGVGWHVERQSGSSS